MDIEKKRAIFFGSILGLAIIFSVIYFIWGSVINHGDLMISGDAPFNVEVFGESKQDCTISPCKLGLKIGDKSLILKKDGYKTIVISTAVKLWRTVSINAAFELLPTIEETASLPVAEPQSQFMLIPESKNGMQKLTKKDDSFKSALVYFPKPILNNIVIGGKNAVLILDESIGGTSGYLVNLNNKTRDTISSPDLADIESGNWSDDGKYLIFRRKNMANLWLLDSINKSVEPLSLATGLKQTSWIYGDNLLFVTEQNYSSQGETTMTLLNEKSPGMLTFGAYDPVKKIYEKIGAFSSITKLPEEFIATANGDTVYFQSDKKNYKIILKRF